jgi:hypothetical protein
MLRRKFVTKKKPFEEAVGGFMQMLCRDKVNPAIWDTGERMLLHYNRHGLVGNPNVLEWLVERKATTCEEWAKAKVEEMKSQ